MIQQQITYLIEGWTPMGPNGEYARKELMTAQTLDGVIQALKYLAAVQRYACFTVSTKLVSISSMLGEVNEIGDRNETIPTPETPPGDPKEIQA